MTQLLHVELTPRAAIQLEQAALWWAENRPAALGAVREDFAAAIELIAHEPGVGARSITRRYPDLRRLFLRRIRYHIYYRVRPERVVIVAFWHASRGSKPSL